MSDPQSEKHQLLEPRPVGKYRAFVGGHRFGKSSKNDMPKNTPYLEYDFFLIEPMEGVDSTLLREGWNKEPVRHRFYLTLDALHQLSQDFLVNACKINLTGRTLLECIPEAHDCEVIVDLIHEPTGDNGDGTLPACDRIASFAMAQ